MDAQELVNGRVPKKGAVAMGLLLPPCCHHLAATVLLPPMSLLPLA